MHHPGIQTILNTVAERGPAGDYRDLGDIRTQRNGDLLIFNYTNAAQYKRRWNAVEQVSRGLIVDAVNNTIVALPWGKFYNLGEMDDVNLHNLPDGPIEATVKMDGSLAVIYHYQGRWHVATRGSFVSDQAQWAQQWIDARDTSGWPTNSTLLCEIIYPENRIVLDYGERAELVLIGARDRRNGYDYCYADLQAVQYDTGLPLVELLPAAGVHELHALSWIVTGVEGWVVRFADGTRVKIKTTEYVRFHRVVFGLTPARVHEAMLLGTWDAFIADIPDEMLPEVKAMHKKISQYMFAECGRLYMLFYDLYWSYTDRKAFAQTVMQQYPTDKSYLFALLDWKHIAPLVLKNAPIKDLFAETPAEV